MTNDRIWRLLSRKLSGEATLTELDELELLLSHFPEAENNLKAFTDCWDISPDPGTEFLEATYMAHLERMKARGFHLNDEPAHLKETQELQQAYPESASYFTIKKLLAAAVIIFIMAAAWMILRKSNGGNSLATTAKPAEILTKNVARSKILLPDGSNVWLNSGSKITYGKEFETADTREVYLTGEAFFDVVKNSKRPFIIHTNKINIKVLGTRFNVKAYENDKTTETSLIRGSVEVFLKSHPFEKYLLKPNQKLVLLNEPMQTNGTTNITQLPPDAALHIEIKPLTYLEGTETNIESSWTKNILSFEDESFAEVAKKMERWFDVEIEFKNKGWEDKFLNGSFEKESVEQAMKALRYTTGFEYRIEGKKILIY